MKDKRLLNLLNIMPIATQWSHLLEKCHGGYILKHAEVINPAGMARMRDEKRKGVSPIPENMKEVLNEAQLMTLHKMKEFGWMLEFIRRPLFQGVIPVLSHPDSKKYGVLEDDGTLNMQSGSMIRE
jgi:hypothetical protein